MKSPRFPTASQFRSVSFSPPRNCCRRPISTMSTTKAKTPTLADPKAVLRWSNSFPSTTPSGIQRKDVIDKEHQLLEDTVLTLNRKEKHGNSRWTWIVTLAMLQPIPKYYPLEQSSITLQGIPLLTISTRISEFMRISSIACTYNPTSARIDCTTPDLVKFVVTIWRDRDTPATNENNLVVILELQKLQGSSIEMSRVRHGLFQAVTTGEKPIIPGERIESLCSTLLLRQVSENESAQNSMPSKRMTNHSSEALKISLKLLKSPFHDSNRLGMESLNVLSNQSIVGYDTAHTLSQCLIFGEGELDLELQGSMLKYFKDTERPLEDNTESSYQFDDFGEEQEQEYAKGTFFNFMHNLALQVLSKSLEVAAATRDTESTLRLNVKSSFWETVINALVYDLSVSCHRPLEASNSAKCLSLISEFSPEAINDPTTRENLISSLFRGNEYGKSHHLNLETETQNLLGRLVQAV